MVRLSQTTFYVHIHCRPLPIETPWGNDSELGQQLPPFPGILCLCSCGSSPFMRGGGMDPPETGHQCESRCCGRVGEYGLCRHMQARQTDNQRNHSTSGLFALFLLNQAEAMQVCRDFAHETNKHFETPEDGLLSEMPQRKHNSEGGKWEEAEGKTHRESCGNRPQRIQGQEGACHAYCKWFNSFTVMSSTFQGYLRMISHQLALLTWLLRKITNNRILWRVSVWFQEMMVGRETDRQMSKVCN